MLRSELETQLQVTGWEKDRWGHYHKSFSGLKRRVKLQKRTMRFERQVCHEGGQYSKPSKSWVKINGAFYGKLSIRDGVLCGLTRN